MRDRSQSRATSEGRPPLRNGAAPERLSQGRAAASAVGADAGAVQGVRRHLHLSPLELPLADVDRRLAIELVVGLADRAGPFHVCFVNAHCCNVARDDAEYLGVLGRADLLFADGVGMAIAGRLLGGSIRDNVNGTDLFPGLCEALAGSEHGIYLLGGQPGVAATLAMSLGDRYPDLRISGHQHGYFDPANGARVAADIAASGAHVLLVAMGVPRQELWIDEHLRETGVRVAMGVGALFDYYSGRIRRAPRWIRCLRMEWLFRLALEPSRLWRRYLIGNPRFVAAVVLQRLRGRSVSPRE